MYQVGRAQSPEKDDPVFDQIGEATQHAEKMSVENGNTVIAIWELMDHDAPYTAYLYFQGDIFKNAY